MVETFLVKEAEELIYDNDKIVEWKEKCQQLGLAKQLELASPDNSPIPSECMNTVRYRIYATLGPRKVLYSDYDRTAIPIEALSLIALSVQENYFSRIEIWYDDKAPDPLVVGRVGSDWSAKWYLIARWGHELLPIEKLKIQAIERMKASTEISLRKTIATATEKLNCIAQNIPAYFDGQVDSYEIQ